MSPGGLPHPQLLAGPLVSMDKGAGLSCLLKLKPFKMEIVTESVQENFGKNTFNSLYCNLLVLTSEPKELK